MFTSHDIVAELRAKPFAPFQIALSDGRAYDVVHPDQAMVTRGHVVLGIPPDAAENSGVRPFAARAFGSAPAFRSSVTQSRQP